MLNFHLFLAITFSFFSAFRAPPFVSLPASHVLSFLSASTTSSHITSFLFHYASSFLLLSSAAFSFPPWLFFLLFCLLSISLSLLPLSLPSLLPPLIIYPTVESNMEILQV